MPQTLSQIQFKKNTATALLLVATVSLVLWIVFNSLVDIYPAKPTSYQTTPAPTTTVAQPLDYHYDNDNF